MARSKRKKGNVGVAVKVIILLVVIALLLGVFFAIMRLSDNFRSDIKTFFLMVDGKVVTNTAQGDFLGKAITVYDLSGDKDYTYRIVRNGSAGDFRFYVNGEQHLFSEREDYTEGFSVTHNGNTLVVELCTMKDVFSKIYGADVETDVSDDASYFRLIITSASGDKEFALALKVPVSVEGITVSPDNIVF